MGNASFPEMRVVVNKVSTRREIDMAETDPTTKMEPSRMMQYMRTAR